jgi:hypothetical protein
MLFASVEENMKLMKTLDDAWNSQDWETFNERHTDYVIMRWPGQPPTRGIESIKLRENIFPSLIRRILIVFNNN